MNQRELVQLINDGTFAIIAPEPGYEKVLGTAAEAGGYDAIEVTGRYDGETEVSFLIPNLPLDLTVKVGRLMRQESVIHSSAGLVFCSDKTTVARTHDDVVHIYDEHETPDIESLDNATLIKLDDGTSAVFQIGLDF